MDLLINKKFYFESVEEAKAAGFDKPDFIEDEDPRFTVFYKKTEWNPAKGGFEFDRAVVFHFPKEVELVALTDEGDAIRNKERTIFLMIETGRLVWYAPFDRTLFRDITDEERVRYFKTFQRLVAEREAAKKRQAEMAERIFAGEDPSDWE